MLRQVEEPLLLSLCVNQAQTITVVYPPAYASVCCRFYPFHCAEISHPFLVLEQPDLNENYQYQEKTENYEGACIFGSGNASNIYA